MATRSLRAPLIVALCLGALALGGCSDDSGTTPGADTGPTADVGAVDQRVSDGSAADLPGSTADLPGGAATQVELDTTLGKIVIELDAAKAPNTVANFLAYVKAGHYDGTIFHRVIATFMIQGGGFDSAYVKKPTNAPIQNEADNGLSNLRGTIAMARTSDPHSATAQFFINVTDNAGLDHSAKTSQGWGYCVFGKVVSGLDTVDKIKAVPTGPGGPFAKDAPQTTVVINSAKVL
jgi:peptidyl-prolyl cis-trans isomerase B (cyclophilin B)